MNHTFRVLYSRNYRLFFLGQAISLIGTWMQRIALGWLVYRLTGSALLLGVVGFWGQLPTFILAPFAGLIADRFDRHKLIITLQSLAMLQALTLATLVLLDLITVGAIIFLGVVLGIINAFEIPIRQAFIVEMIDKREDLPNAIALNSSMVNSARLLGPSLAGIITTTIGEGLCFLLNGFSYLAVLIGLLAMKIKPVEKKVRKGLSLHALADGFTYAYRHNLIRSLLFLLAISSLMGMPYQVLMPVLAKSVLHGQANTMGFLMGASGAGALIGAYYLAQRKNSDGLVSLVPKAAVVFGCGLITLSFSSSFYLSFGILIFTGLGMMVQMATTNTILQTVVDDDKRGRVMSIYTMAFMGMGPFGSLLSGFMADHIGTQNSILVGGICCVISGVVYYFKIKNIQLVKTQ